MMSQITWTDRLVTGALLGAGLALTYPFVTAIFTGTLVSYTLGNTIAFGAIGFAGGAIHGDCTSACSEVQWPSEIEVTDRLERRRIDDLTRPRSRMTWRYDNNGRGGFYPTTTFH